MARKSRPAKEEVVKGPWSAQEDKVLANYIKLNGEGKWRDLPHKAGLNRCGKSCRLRWLNYLKPGVKRGKMSEEEEDLIIRMHKLIGNRWSLIAGRLPGRTDNEIKNYWNTNLSKRIGGNKTSRGHKRKLDQIKDAQNQETTESIQNASNTLGSETLSSSMVVQEVHDSSDGLADLDDIDENSLVTRSTDPNASTDQKQKEVVEECDDNNYLMNASNGVNVADDMPLAYGDFPISTPEVTTKLMVDNTWDWSTLSDPLQLHDEWDLHAVDTFLISGDNWIF